MDENPPDLTEEMENLYSRLLQTIDKLEAEIKDLSVLYDLTRLDLRF